MSLCGACVDCVYTQETKVHFLIWDYLMDVIKIRLLLTAEVISLGVLIFLSMNTII